MELLKKLTCLNCGEPVDVSADGRSASCKYCGRIYKIGTTLSESGVLAFSQGNEYWKTFRFTDAKRSFLEVTKSAPEFSDAWWGAFISEYGIEFGHNRFGELVPTCHRVHTVPVSEDNNYIKALEAADAETKAEYQRIGARIELARQGILTKAQSGETYDIFICFKATEMNDERRRTIDFYLGEELHKELTNQGYKVFFSPETLMRVVEQEYEPYIYRALSTAKVMLLLCSDIREIESAWVKNEWGRYLDMRNGQGLIPICGNKYEPFSPSQLPGELQKLNAIEYNERLFETLNKKLDAYFPERVKEREQQAQRQRDEEYNARYAQQLKEQEERNARLLEQQQKQIEQMKDAIECRETALTQNDARLSLDALEWFQKGENYFYGINGVRKNHKKAEECYSRAALNGHSNAPRMVGSCSEIIRLKKKRRRQLIAGWILVFEVATAISSDEILAALLFALPAIALLFFAHKNKKKIEKIMAGEMGLTK